MPNVVYIACKEWQFFCCRPSLLQLGFDLQRTYSDFGKTGDEVTLAIVELSQGGMGAGSCGSVVMGSISDG